MVSGLERELGKQSSNSGRDHYVHFGTNTSGERYKCINKQQRRLVFLANSLEKAIIKTPFTHPAALANRVCEMRYVVLPLLLSTTNPIGKDSSFLNITHCIDQCLNSVTIKQFPVIFLNVQFLGVFLSSLSSFL